MVAPAPVSENADGSLRLDVKFVDGLHLHMTHWPGEIDVVLYATGGAIPFGADYRREELPVRLHVLSPGANVPEELLRRADLVLASGDMVEALDLPMRASAPVVLVVEYTLETRLRIALLDRHRSLARRVWSVIWNLRQERRRRRAFAAAKALQVNGYPAAAAYGPLNRDTHLYLDNRMSTALMADAGEMALRASRLASGAPLRLVHSGRLEPMKGAQDIAPLVRALVAAGLDFTLDVFGTGSLESEVAALAQSDPGRVRLHAPVDFKTVLVPWMRANADMFVSFHRQSDPSCTYLESMGCGVPVVGYDNAMLAALARASASGWTVPMGRPQALAGAIRRLNAARAEIGVHAERGLAFARSHDFEAEFAARMAHCVRIADGTERT